MDDAPINDDEPDNSYYIGEYMKEELSMKNLDNNPYLQSIK